MEQGEGLGAQAIDQVLQIEALGPRAITVDAIQAGQLANPVAVQIDHQPVMMQPHRYLTANRARRHRVEQLPHLDRAGAPHPYREQLEVSKAKPAIRSRPNSHR